MQFYQTHQGWARSLNEDKKLIRYDLRSRYHQFNIKMTILKNTSIKFQYWYYKNLCFLNLNVPRTKKYQIMTVYNLPENIDLTLICTHKSCNSHNTISNLHHFDYKYIGFISYTFRNKWLQIDNLNIKWYNFEISRKGTIGNLYQIIWIDFSDL